MGMMMRLKNLAIKFLNYMNNEVPLPPQEETVFMLIHRTASLELSKGEYVELAGIRGCCGPFKLSGNSLPVFEYTVFEKSIMEFIKVRVEVSKPNRIEFIATIDSTTAPERHGEKVEVKDKYKEPFEILVGHLVKYFPFASKHKVKTAC